MSDTTKPRRAIRLASNADTPSVVLPERGGVVIGCRWRDRHTVRVDSESGVFEEQRPPIDTGLQAALLREKPLRFFDGVPGEWAALRSPRAQP